MQKIRSGTYPDKPANRPLAPRWSNTGGVNEPLIYKRAVKAGSCVRSLIIINE